MQAIAALSELRDSLKAAAQARDESEMASRLQDGLFHYLRFTRMIDAMTAPGMDLRNTLAIGSGHLSEITHEDFDTAPEEARADRKARIQAMLRHIRDRRANLMEARKQVAAVARRVRRSGTP